SSSAKVPGSAPKSFSRPSGLSSSTLSSGFKTSAAARMRVVFAIVSSAGFAGETAEAATLFRELARSGALQPHDLPFQALQKRRAVLRRKRLRPAGDLAGGA